ncbi:MAG: single-stranded-DNA-specific exonuclease RecJ [Bacteroidota bacterium]
MNKRWVQKEQGNKEAIDRLIKELGVDYQIANLLVQRGMDNYDKAHRFFRPNIKDLHDPFLMKDMDKAIERIDTAIDNNEKILVYGDYDVDGTTSVALMISFLRKHHQNISFYIPDRYEEGYGISYKGIDYAYSNEFTLVIALDCGIKAVEKISYASQKQIDFIICDHHLPGDELPEAYAILDPKRPGDEYPYKELSGCGVGFKLIQAFSQVHDKQDPNKPLAQLYEYLDLVAVSIASDIVPITEENRTLAYYGLKRINQNPRPGLEAILEYSNVKRLPIQYQSSEQVFNKKLTISDLVFIIGPRINAAGRMKDAKQSVELLICNDKMFAQRIGREINKNNTDRKELDTIITQHANQIITEGEEFKTRKSIVIYNKNWHKGIIGIVASRLIEKFYKPTIVLTLSNNGLITGSARSIKNFDIYQAISNCSNLLENFGGHKYAAGLSLKPENLDSFVQCFEQYASTHIKDYELTPEIEIDSELPLTEITDKFVRILKQFAPFGPGNAAPVFISRHVVESGQSRIVGKNHLKFKVAQPDKYHIHFPAIAFQQGHQQNKLQKMIPFDICYHLEENHWNGTTTLQLNIKDIKFPND